MDAAFLERLAISFVVGGATVALFTTAAERYGSRYGGLLLSFPVKVTLSLILIAIQEGLAPAAVSASVVPLGMASNVVFLAATVLALRRLPRIPALALGMLGWLLAALVIVLYPPSDARWALAGYLAVAGASLAALSAIRALRGEHQRKRVQVFSGWRVVGRGIAAGAVVASTLVIARYGGPVLAGLFAVFPSAWTTTMIVLSRDQGPDFTGATARTMIAGSASPVAFGLVMALSLESWGIVGACAAGMAVAVAISALAGASLHALDRRLRPPMGAPQAAAPKALAKR